MKARILLISVISLMTLFTTISSAQPKRDNGWKERIMSEKIAFLTTEIGITPKEAQNFWPVYNQINEERDKIMNEIFRSYKDLMDAVEGGKDETEIEKYLNVYLNAQKKIRKLDDETPLRYKKVLSQEKIARLYIAEEKFRRNQIHRLNHGKR